jgi:hypothetical protein
MATNLNQQIEVPALPDIGSAPQAYDRGFVDQSNGVLRVFQRRLLSALAALFGPQGGRHVNTPYGAFQDLTDQSVAANTATAMTFDTTDFSNGIRLGKTGSPSTSKIYVDYDGLYNLQWSGQFQNTDTQIHDASVWVRKNGVDIAGTTGYVSVPNKHGGVNGHGIDAWNYFIEMNAGDYVELWWSATNTAITLQTYPAGVTPTRPTTASIVVTVTFVSNRSA